MYPELFSRLPTYGPTLLLGVMCGILIFRRAAKRMPMDLEWSTDVIIMAILFGFAGARLLQVIVNHERYLTSINGVISIFKVWDGGYAYLGGVVSGSLTLYAVRRRISLPLMADTMVAPLAFTHAVGRLGCFGAGCCHGRAGASAFFGVEFKAESAARAWCSAGAGPSCPAGIHFHPTQLYEAVGILGVMIFLILYRSRKRFHGHLTALYLINYGLLRFFIEIFRGDPNRGFALRFETPTLRRWLGFHGGDPLFLSTSQLLSLVLIVCGIVIIWYTTSNSHTRSAK